MKCVSSSSGGGCLHARLPGQTQISRVGQLFKPGPWLFAVLTAVVSPHPRLCFAWIVLWSLLLHVTGSKSSRPSVWRCWAGTLRHSLWPGECLGNIKYKYSSVHVVMRRQHVNLYPIIFLESCMQTPFTSSHPA